MNQVSIHRALFFDRDYHFRANWVYTVIEQGRRANTGGMGHASLPGFARGCAGRLRARRRANADHSTVCFSFAHRSQHT
jgi:hypothetical protein